MMWGCLGIHGVGVLVVLDGNVNAEQYIDVLDTYLLQSVENIFGEAGAPFIFQQDNAPIHTARATQEWLFDNNINVINWPAQSPDLNPIENLWDELGKAVIRDSPHTRQGLIQVLLHAWNAITPQYVRNLYDSISCHVRAVHRVHGYPSKY